MHTPSYLQKNVNIEKLRLAISHAVTALDRMERFYKMGTAILTDPDMIDLINNSMTVDQKSALNTMYTFIGTHKSTLHGYLEILDTLDA